MQNETLNYCITLKKHSKYHKIGSGNMNQTIKIKMGNDDKKLFDARSVVGKLFLYLFVFSDVCR